MRVLLVTLLCLLAVGCNSDPRCRRETALMRAEYLDLEDKYYLLKSEYDAIKGESGGSSGVVISQPYYADGEVIYDDVIYDGAISDGGIIYDQPATGIDTSARSNPQSKSQGASSVVQPTEQGVESFNDIQISLPDVDPEPGKIHKLPAPESESNNSQSMLQLNSPDTGVSFEAATPAAQITEVFINRNVSRGHDVDGIPGDEGIDLLIQPRTASGSIELQTGELTVSVMDPTERPERQRIGLWKFLPRETKLFFANDELGSRGILLHLPWDQTPPVNEKLLVHVRFITPDGRVLKTSSEMRIEPPSIGYAADDPLVTGWTKRDSRWIPDVDQPDQNPAWRNRDSYSAQIQAPSSGRSGGAQPIRGRIPAIPAKAEIKKPSWRPIR